MKIATTLGSLAAVLMFASNPAWAGSATIASTDNTRISYEYTDTMLRMDMPSEQQSAYMIIRDGQMYSVTEHNGEPMVMNMSQVWRMMGDIAANMNTAPDIAATELVSMENTGKSETHAGLKGEVYLVTVKEGDSKPRQVEVVLSDHPSVRALMEAMIRFSKQTAAAMGETLRAQADSMHVKLESMNKGVLRFGNDFRVVEISDSRISDDRFTLPAPPQEMPNLGNFGSFSGGATPQGGETDASAMEQAGAIMGGIFGGMGAAEETQDDGEDGGSDQPREGAAPMEELGEAFKSIFGGK